jgi:hypothetical protein
MPRQCVLTVLVVLVAVTAQAGLADSGDAAPAVAPAPPLPAEGGTAESGRGDAQSADVARPQNGAAFEPQYASRIAVAAFRAEAADAELAEHVADILTVEVEKFDGVDVLARSDLRGILDRMAESQLLGCEDPRCFVDVASLLPARRLLTGSLNRLGSVLFVQAALIDLVQGRVVARASAPRGATAEDIAGALRSIALGLVTGDPQLLASDTTVKGEVTADMLERVRIAQRPRGVALHAHVGGVFSASFAFGNPTDPAYPGAFVKVAVDVPVSPWVAVTPVGGAQYYYGRFVNQATFSFSADEEQLGFKDTDGVFVADYGLFDANAGVAVEVQVPTGLVRPYAFAGATADLLVLDTSDLTFAPDPGEADLVPPFGKPIPFAQSIALGGGGGAGAGVDFSLGEHAGVSLERSLDGQLPARERVAGVDGVITRTAVLPLTGVLLTIGGFYEL